MTTPRASAPASTGIFHPERLLAVLGRFKVSYVLTGPIAARLNGSPLLVAIADIVPAVTPENFEALSTALRHLGARRYSDATPLGTELELTADSLASTHAWDLVTSCGRLRMLFQPAGTKGYPDLAASADRFSLHGDEIRVASLRDLVRMHDAPEAVDAAAHRAILQALLEQERT